MFPTIWKSLVNSEKAIFKTKVNSKCLHFYTNIVKKNPQNSFLMWFGKLIWKLRKQFSPPQRQQGDWLALDRKAVEECLLVRQTQRKLDAISRNPRHLKTQSESSMEKGISVEAPPGLCGYGRGSSSSRASLEVAIRNCDLILTSYTEFLRYLGKVASLVWGNQIRAYAAASFNSLCQGSLLWFVLVTHHEMEENSQTEVENCILAMHGKGIFSSSDNQWAYKLKRAGNLPAWEFCCPSWDSGSWKLLRSPWSERDTIRMQVVFWCKGHCQLILHPMHTVNEHNQFTDTKPQITSSLLAVPGTVIEAFLGQYIDADSVLHADLSTLSCKLKQ